MTRLDWQRAKRPRDPVRMDREGRPGDLPPTPPQLALIRRLCREQGIERPTGLNRREAGQWIDAHTS